MSGKITLALLSILAIVLISASFVSAQQPQQPSPTPTAPTSISSKSSSTLGWCGGWFEVNYTLSSRNLAINGEVFKAGNIEILITYTIDKSKNYSMPIEMTEIDPHWWGVNINGSVVLPLLPVGNHSITVYGKWTAPLSAGPDQPYNEVELAQATLNFTVRATDITISSPENRSYLSKDLSLNFTTDVPVSWKGYSLDNQDNVTLTGNFTLTDLTYGNHTIAVYANNTAGNMGASQIVNFIIEAPKSSEPFSLLIFVAVITVLAVVAIVVVRAFLQKPSDSLQASD